MAPDHPLSLPSLLFQKPNPTGVVGVVDFAIDRAQCAEAAIQHALMLSARGDHAAAELAVAQAQLLIELSRQTCMLLEKHLPPHNSSQADTNIHYFEDEQGYQLQLQAHASQCQQQNQQQPFQVRPQANTKAAATPAAGFWTGYAPFAADDTDGEPEVTSRWRPCDCAA